MNNYKGCQAPAALMPVSYGEGIDEKHYQQLKGEIFAWYHCGSVIYAVLQSVSGL